MVNSGDQSYQSYTDAAIDLRIDPQGVPDSPNDEPEPSLPSIEIPATRRIPIHNSLQPGDVDQDGEITLQWEATNSRLARPLALGFSYYL